MMRERIPTATHFPLPSALYLRANVFGNQMAVAMSKLYRRSSPRKAIRSIRVIVHLSSAKEHYQESVPDDDCRKRNWRARHGLEVVHSQYGTLIYLSSVTTRTGPASPLCALNLVGYVTYWGTRICSGFPIMAKIARPSLILSRSVEEASATIITKSY